MLKSKYYFNYITHIYFSQRKLEFFFLCILLFYFHIELRLLFDFLIPMMMFNIKTGRQHKKSL